MAIRKSLSRLTKLLTMDTKGQSATLFQAALVLGCNARIEVLPEVQVSYPY